jgi:hypothetical protein
VTVYRAALHSSARKPRRIIRCMTTSAKRVPPSKARQSSHPPPQQPASPSQPYLRFYHSPALRSKTLAVLVVVEQAPDAKKHSDDLSGLVVELMNSGMDSYFMKPLKQAKAGFIVEQSANLGLVSVQQVMASVIRQVIGRMEGPQLLSVCRSIREFML